MIRDVARAGTVGLHHKDFEIAVAARCERITSRPATRRDTIQPMAFRPSRNQRGFQIVNRDFESPSVRGECDLAVRRNWGASGRIAGQTLLFLAVGFDKVQFRVVVAR